MKQYKVGSYSIILFVIFYSTLNTTIAQADSVSSNISEERFILINGIAQWITIKGERSKPAILFLHGGPGSPLSPYSDNIYKDWEKDFIIVQWDQRGTGKTFGKYAPEELTPQYLRDNPLSPGLMVNDCIKLTEYLLKYLGKQKIILLGTSWGSVLGVKMAMMRPHLFYAYIGHSQIVNPVIDIDLYSKVYKMAKDKNDKEALDVLNTIGTPPYYRAKKTGALLRIIKKYERARSMPAPEEWFELSKDYDNEKDNLDRGNGDDYSFVNYVGDSVLGVQAMNTTINFMNDKLTFQIPVYLIQGEDDILTPP
jgi:pimeloyl-ACP methyl ester carboxylesterase